LLPLADDHVISLAGAQWPTGLSGGEAANYRYSDLFKPDTDGGILENESGLPLTELRSGTAVAKFGVNKFLIWGGGVDQIAEVFTESSNPQDGTFDNTYIIEGDITSKSGTLYFSSLTSLGKSEGNEGRLLAIGGIRHNGAKWLPPDPSDVYLVVVTIPAKGKKRIKTVRVGGLGTGVYMHQASLTDANHVLVTGGFTSYGAPTTFTMRQFDIGQLQDKATMDAVLAGQKKLTLTEPASSKAVVKRGGHGGVRLKNDCVLMFGGVAEPADLLKPHKAAIDIYCPKHLDPTE
jgi:hypothetical protein